MFDLMLFHECRGAAWKNVPHMRECVSNVEWLEHAAYIRRQRDLEEAAIKKAQRGGGRGRGRL